MTSGTQRPLEARVLVLMADHIADAVGSMVYGHWRFVCDADVLGGRAGLAAARTVIEFLVGREKGWSEKDIWPCDYCPTWTVEDDEAELLRDRLQEIDQFLSHLSLRRAETPGDAPEGWTATVERLVDLFDRFAEESRDAPGSDRFKEAVVRARAIPEEVKGTDSR